jgi:GNAT superfamily N-acetyltransferase
LNFQYKGESWAEVNNLKKFLKNIFFNPFEHYHVDKLMFAAGLYVDENFRKRGIAVEMIKAREKVAKCVGIDVCSNVFSSLGAQKAALKAGYEESFSIKYSNLAKLTPDGFFPGIKDEFMKIMSKKF